MKIEKSKEALSNYFDASNRMRWGILVVVTVIFTILLYPNLVITKHQVNYHDSAATLAFQANVNQPEAKTLYQIELDNIDAAELESINIIWAISLSGILSTERFFRRRRISHGEKASAGNGRSVDSL